MTPAATDEKDCPGVLLCAVETASVAASLPLLATALGGRRGAELGRRRGGAPGAAVLGLLGGVGGLAVGTALVPLALASGAARLLGHAAGRAVSARGPASPPTRP